MTIKKYSMSGLKAFAYTNIVSNGNFINTTSWGTDGCTISASDNILSVIGNGLAVNPNTYQDTMFTLVNGKKFFISCKAYVTNAICNNIILQAYNGSGFIENMKIQSTPSINTVYNINGIVTIGAIVGQLRPVLSHWYSDAATANGKVMKVQDFFAIDLTGLFGADNEPSDTDCENIFKFVDGTTQPNLSKTLSM
jgi:hypothetical protein